MIEDAATKPMKPHAEATHVRKRLIVSRPALRPKGSEQTPLQKLHAKAKRTAAQDLLGFQLKAAKIDHGAEYHWNPKTKQRADFAAWKLGISHGIVLIEVDGGLFVNGGHTRGAARERDYERDAEAMLLGFRVLRCSPRQVKNGKAIQWITSLLK